MRLVLQDGRRISMTYTINMVSKGKISTQIKKLQNNRKGKLTNGRPELGTYYYLYCVLKDNNWLKKLCNVYNNYFCFVIIFVIMFVIIIIIFCRLRFVQSIFIRGLFKKNRTFFQMKQGR